MKVLRDIKIHIGAMALGASVVQDVGLATNYILPQNRKLLDLDMETHGVYYVTQNAPTKIVEAISVKVVSDFADSHKNDDYQHYGSFIRAQFVLKNTHALLKTWH